MKPKLLIIELWGLGDLVIATPFIRAAAEKFDITLLAKPYALELQTRLWPDIQIIPFEAPWTAFTKKYRLWRWPWRELLRVRDSLAKCRFDYGLSARWDPRDHVLLQLFDVKNRLGFPRLRSDMLLTQPLPRPGPLAHHFDYWRTAAEALGVAVPERPRLALPARKKEGAVIMVHSGARLPARIWPVEQFHGLVQRLRAAGYVVQVACDSNQLSVWQALGENSVNCPRSVSELLMMIDRAQCFIGNCSGPGHLAAISGLPTFTIFGPSMHEWFLPLHPQAEWMEGKACPYKPCADYCRFSRPFCIQDLPVDAVWERVAPFAARHARGSVVMPAAA